MTNYHDRLPPKSHDPIGFAVKKRPEGTMKRLTLWTVVVCLIFGAVLFLLDSNQIEKRNSADSIPGPKTIDEAIAVVENAGLIWIYSGANQHDEIYASETPISQESTHNLLVGDLSHKAWVGRVQITNSWKGRHNPAGPNSKQWGNLWIVGDPELIARITK